MRFDLFPSFCAWKHWIIDFSVHLPCICVQTFLWSWKIGVIECVIRADLGGSLFLSFWVRECRMEVLLILTILFSFSIFLPQVSIRTPAENTSAMILFPLESVGHFDSSVSHDSSCQIFVSCKNRSWLSYDLLKTSQVVGKFDAWC